MTIDNTETRSCCGCGRETTFDRLCRIPTPEDGPNAAVEYCTRCVRLKCLGALVVIQDVGKLFPPIPKSLKAVASVNN